MNNSSTDIPGMGTGIELLVDLRPYIRHCGASRRPAWCMGQRRLLDYLVVYIAEGIGRFEVDGVDYDAEEGDLFWIPPDTTHTMEGFEPSMVCPYAHFDLVYRPDTSHWDFTIPPGTLDLQEFGSLMHPPVADARINALKGRLRTRSNARIGDIIREICEEAARAQPYSQLKMSGLMLQIVAELLLCQETTDGESEHIPLLEEAEKYMRAHVAEDLRVEDLAGLAGLSASHFRHLFGSYFGRSPQAHLRFLRIRRAKELMNGSDLNLGEIARLCGFATVHSFSRAFRAVEGEPPSSYRRYGAVSVRVDTRTTPYPGAS